MAIIANVTETSLSCNNYDKFVSLNKVSHNPSTSVRVLLTFICS